MSTPPASTSLVATPWPPPGWYPDPITPNAQRFFDGVAWTHHVVPPPLSEPYAWRPPQPPWKGAEFGLPAVGPGSLAEPGRRLGARLLDALVLAPVFIAFSVLAIALVAPRAGPMLPAFPSDTSGPGPTPGVFWVGLALVGCLAATVLVMVAYETVATAKWGRTLGKAWVHIRPVRTNAEPLGWGGALGRTVLYWLSACLGWFGLLDPLWCLWDANRQCVHDKVAGTLVINDPIVPPYPMLDLRAGPTAIPPLT